MRVKKTEIQVKEVEVIIDDYHVCDKCNKKVNHANHHMYDAFDFEMIYKEGEQYPESGYGHRYEMELCKPCAEDLMKLLKENAYRITTEEWDY